MSEQNPPDAEVLLYREHIHFLNNILTNIYYSALVHKCSAQSELKHLVEHEITRVREEQEKLKDSVSKLKRQPGGSP